MTRKRILWCGESSFLSTGYATYSLEVLRRFHDSGKYDICELGCYAPPNDPRCQSVPWKFIPVMPDQNDKTAVDRYAALRPLSDFGSDKFEDACLRFKPSCCADARDVWMFAHETTSPFRDFYNLSLMPTVDAAPQDEQWLSTIMMADAVFTYTDWGREVLRKQSNGQIKLKGSASPGADINILKPVQDRRAHRQMMGVDPDCFIVGTVMRNQKRKLYPDLIPAFAIFLQTAPPEISKKTYLYMHTTWPDVGWDIPKLLNEANVGHKCVFTYNCQTCGSVFASFFSDAKAACRVCGNPTATLPNSHAGISREALGNVMNLFDVYVAYANSEGLGMPQVEAAACGVPVFSVDYSGMSDVVRKVKGYPIKVQRLSRESETHCWRALPDNADFVEQLINFLRLPEAIRKKKGYEARKAVEEHYDYDKTAKLWMDHFDSVEVRPDSDTWDSPPRFHSPNLNVPENLSNEDFVRWGMFHVAGRPDLVNSYVAMRMVRDLTWQATVPHFGGLYFNEESTLGMQNRFENFDRNSAMNAMIAICEHRNHWERARTAK